MGLGKAFAPVPVGQWVQHLAHDSRCCPQRKAPAQCHTEQPVTLLSPDECELAGFQSGSETSPQPDQ